MSERATYTVEEWRRIVGLSKNSAYAAIARGEVPSLKFGKRILIPKAAADKMLAGEQATAAPAA